jgi:hypothetical protein
MRLWIPVVAVSSLFVGTASAESDSLDDLLGPREIAVGEAMRGGATGGSSVGLNPAGLPLNRELVFEGGYGYRGSDSASLIGVSACDSTNVVPGCFFYDRASSSPDLDGQSLTRTTNIFGLSLSRVLVPRVLVGVAGKYYRFSSDVMDEKSANGFQFDAGATVRLTDIINIGFSGQNLVGTQDSTQFPRAIGGGILARPVDIFSLSFDSRWKTNGDGARYGGGGELFLRAGNYGIPLRIGGLADTGLDAKYFTGGIGISNLRWGIDVGARKEVSGGDETLILASMRFYGPRLAAPALDAE